MPSEQEEVDSDEPNRKYPDVGAMKPLPPMLVGIISPPDPKLNLGVALSKPGVSTVVVTVCSDTAVGSHARDGNEPNRKGPGDGTIKLFYPVPVLPSAVPVPKLNVGVGASAGKL